MPSCWTAGILICSLLASLCIWNCIQRKNSSILSNWYGCVNQDYEPVDYYLIYKLPQISRSENKYIKHGVGYMYLSPAHSSRLQGGGISSVLSFSDSTTDWVMSERSIAEPFSMPGLTLNKLLSDDDIVKKGVYILYNDEWPNGTTSLNKGHSKGVLVLTEKGGFWMIHSVPKYPSVRFSEYVYPNTGHKYGQSILCISLPPISGELIQVIGQQLLMNEAYVYDHGVSAKYASNAIINSVINGERIKSGPYYKFHEIPSANGKTFISFAKYKKYGDDLYSAFVAPFLHSSLLVESWRNGPSPLPSNCSLNYKVLNVEEIVAKSASVKFSSHDDHSKWALTNDINKPYVCIGDINRMKTQYKRGGGTVCFWSLSVWNRFKDLIDVTDNCK